MTDLHLQASSIAESVSRATTDLGSSKHYPVHPAHMEGTGMFDAPPWDTHVIVYAKHVGFSQTASLYWGFPL